MWLIEETHIKFILRISQQGYAEFSNLIKFSLDFYLFLELYKNRSFYWDNGCGVIGIHKREVLKMGKDSLQGVKRMQLDILKSIFFDTVEKRYIGFFPDGTGSMRPVHFMGRARWITNWKVPQISDTIYA